MSVLDSSVKFISPITPESYRERFTFSFDSSNLFKNSLKVVPQSTPDDKLYNEIKLKIPENELKADLSSISVNSSSSREWATKFILPTKRRNLPFECLSPIKVNHNQSWALSPEKKRIVLSKV